MDKGRIEGGERERRTSASERRDRRDPMRHYADVIKDVQIAFTIWEYTDREDPETIRLAAFNPAAQRLSTVPLSEYIGQRLRDLAPYAADGPAEAALARVARDGGSCELAVDRLRDPNAPRRVLAARIFPITGSRIGMVLEDVTAQTVERRLQEAEHRVLEMIATGAPLAECLRAVVLAVEDHSPPVLGSILLLDRDGVCLRHGAAPNLPPAYQAAVDGVAIGPGVGSCGTAAYLKRPVIVTDLAIDPLWDGDLRDQAVAHGLRACWSIPIFATDRRVLGTLAFYYAAPRSPTDVDLASAQRAARLAAIAIERRELEDQLRALSAHMESALEAQRTGIAREIHDELGQSLTALKMDIAWILRRAAGDTLDRDGLTERLRGMSGLADGMIQQVRKISAELRPGVLDDLGLVAAIEWQAQEFEERTGVACFVKSGGEGSVDRSTSTAVFRIFQEALTNVTRHAMATRVDVRIALDPAELRMEIADDGVGFPPEASRSPKSLGLLGIRERAIRLGGVASFDDITPRGARVSLRVPLGAPTRAPIPGEPGQRTDRR